MRKLGFGLELVKIFNLFTKVIPIIFLLAVFLYSSVHQANASVKIDCDDVGNYKYFNDFTTLYFDYAELDIRYDHADEPIGKTRLQTLNQSCIDALKTSPSSGKSHFYLGLTHYALGNPSKAYQSYKKAAMHGEKRSLFAMVILYLNNQIDADDPKKVITWLNESANSGYSPAQHALAHYYYKGILGIEGNPERALRTKVDYKESFKWNQAAAQQGYVYSYIGVAITYFHGFGETEPDLEKAEFWFEKAFQEGLEFNYRNLVHFGTKGLTKNYVHAAKWFERAVMQGDVFSAYLLFETYANGRGVEIDIEKGEKWLLQAIKSGFKPTLDLKTRAAYFGLYLFEKEDLAEIDDVFSYNLEDERLAKRYLKYGATDGFFIGQGFERGTRENHLNYKNAHDWYINSVSGDGVNKSAPFSTQASSLFRLGLLYKEGKGVKRDLTVAEGYFLRSANWPDRGNKNAQYELGKIYISDKYHETTSEGLELLEKAAIGGQPRPLLELARFYMATGDYLKAFQYTQYGLLKSFSRFNKELFGSKLFMPNLGPYGYGYGYEYDRTKVLKDIFLLHARLITELYQGYQDQIYWLFNALQWLQMFEIDSAFYSAVLKMSAEGEGTRPLIDGIKRRSSKYTVIQSRIDDLLENIEKTKEVKEIKTLSRKQHYLEFEMNFLRNNLKSSYSKAVNQITSISPAKYSEFEKLLKNDEAILNYITGGAKSYLFIIKKNQPAKLIELDINESYIKELVFDVRTSLTPTTQSSQYVIPNFNLDKSYFLYEKIFKPAEPYLKGVNNLMVVSGDALQGLPLSILIDKKPLIDRADIYSNQHWLVNRFAITYYPSLPIFLLARTVNLPQNDMKRFLGFADPVLNEHPKSITTALMLRLENLFRGGHADLAKLRKLPRLPNTAREIEAISANIGFKNKNNIFVQKGATESQLKKLNASKKLLDYDVIAFATHGLMTTQGGFTVNDYREPGLVLTPPEKATDIDDGLLTANEITELDLNANLVILSACNTAVTNKYDSSRISRLVESFIHAGARSVLASHWYIDTYSTEMLIVGLFENLRKSPGLSKANALQQSMLQVINACDWRCKLGLRPNQWAHPIYWAPFTIVGE